MGFISQLFGYILNWLYLFLNNYGVAIIIFSIVLRVLLIPKIKSRNNRII